MNNYSFDPSRKFLDPEQVLFTSGLKSGMTFADLGSGSGFYTLAAAKIVSDQGMVYSVDILESALEHIAAEARLKKYRNIKTFICNLENTEACAIIPAGSVDLILVANIIHQVKNSQNLFAESYRLLKTGGKLLVIEWNDKLSPIGPDPNHRITEDKVNTLANQSALKPAGNMNVDAYHYGLMYLK